MNLFWWIGGGLLLLGAKASASPRVDSPEGFVAMLRDALSGVAPHLSALAQQLVIAHAALESGWGQSTPARLGNNFFNVTRIRSDTRPVIESGDLEYDAGGVARPITQRFAKYGSVGEALAEYFGLLSRKYQTALARLEAGDSAGFVEQLRAGGYFTLPLADYQKRYSDVLHSVQRRWS